MKKSRGITILLLSLVLLVLGAYTAAAGWGSDRVGSAANIKQGLDLAGGVSITYQVAGEEKPSSEDMDDTVYKLQKRVEGYSTEAIVYQQGDDRINIEIPGVSDANEILEALGKPGSLQFLDKDFQPVLEGTDVKEAKAGQTQDQMGNSSFVVQLILTDEGKEKFADATTKAAVSHDVIYILYDDQIISSPVVNEPITAGEAIITGMDSYEEADELATTIRIGGLKVTLEELSSSVVGAQLGAEAIGSSLKAGLIGFVLIAVFMIAVYFLPGAASVLALAIYVVLMVLCINGFDWTLTLPGIAGIILSIGMAVDANVIIFARIREELAAGSPVQAAVKTGFQKAFPAILDGNVTTFLAAIVLGVLGTGPVKGFAQTLGLGIVLSMFTALVVTRLILNALYAIGLRDAKYYGVAKERRVIAFLSKKAVFFTCSLAVIAAGFIGMGVHRANGENILNYSLEFEGGTSTNLTFDHDLSIAEIDADVVPVVESITNDAAVQTQKVEGTNQVIIKTRTLSLEEREAMAEAMESQFGVDPSTILTESISSTISGEMKADAILAVSVSAVLMLLYIWFRFKDVRFGASAVLALVHDVLVVLAFYALLRVSVGTNFIACMLTIIGYSINATIVVFDRVRENLHGRGQKDLAETVNQSISQTLSRSIFTSLTTFVMVAALYVLGVSSIREFALPLMAGIICGTYSSVCLAGALWYVLRTAGKKQEGKTGKKSEKKQKQEAKG